MGSAERSWGETNEGMERWRDSAMWLMFIASGTAKANCMRAAGRGRRATNHVAPATAASASAAESQSRSGMRRGVAAAARAMVLDSVPDKVPNAKDRSRADWKRCSGLFSRHLRTMRSSAGETRRVESDDAVDKSGGSYFKTAVMVSAVVSRRKTRVSESIS